MISTLLFPRLSRPPTIFRLPSATPFLNSGGRSSIPTWLVTFKSIAWDSRLSPPALRAWPTAGQMLTKISGSPAAVCYALGERAFDRAAAIVTTTRQVGAQVIDRVIDALEARSGDRVAR